MGGSGMGWHTSKPRFATEPEGHSMQADGPIEGLTIASKVLGHVLWTYVTDLCKIVSWVTTMEVDAAGITARISTAVGILQLELFATTPLCRMTEHDLELSKGPPMIVIVPPEGGNH